MSSSVLTEDQQVVRETAARVAREVYGPHALEWDQNRTEFPIEERRRLGSLGMLGISLPEEYGGSGAPILDALVAIEELAKICRPAGFQVFESNTGPAAGGGPARVGPPQAEVPSRASSPATCRWRWRSPSRTPVPRRRT